MLWGGRFEEGPSEVFKRFSWSLHFDRRLFKVDILGSQAYARALARVGILTAAECTLICDTLASIEQFDEAGAATASVEDIHS